jgi:hypothetical protein
MKAQHRSAKSRSAVVTEPAQKGGKPAKQVYEITIRVPRILVFHLEKVIFGALLVYAAILTAPVTVHIPNVGLDYSWMTALNVLTHSNYKFGTDVIFTYGPLGFVDVPQNVGGNLPAALAIRFLIWSLLLGQLAYVYVRGAIGRLRYFIALGSIILVHQFLTSSLDYMLAATALFLMLQHPPEKQSWPGTTTLALLTSIAFLSKQSAYVMLLFSLFAYFLFRAIKDRTELERASWLHLTTAAVAPFLAYVIYHPSVAGLWSYLTGMLQISSGYSVAMSFAGFPKDQGFMLAILVALMVGFAGVAVWRKWVTIETVVCVMAAFCFALRHSVVRTDGHVSFVFAFSVPLLGLLILHSRPTKSALLSGGLAFAAIGALSLVEMNPFWGTLAARSWSPVSYLEEIARLFHWRSTMAAYSAQAEANLRADQLPPLLTARIGRAPVIFFPNELAYGPANGLNMLPLYTLQAYAAYTPALDVSTGDHLLSTPADTRFLMSWGQVDNRHIILDDPTTWNTIYNGFLPEATDGGVLLLRKRRHPQVFHPRPPHSTVARITQWQEVPYRNHAVTISIKFSTTILGTLRKLLYKIDPVYIELQPDVGSPQRFRVIPYMLQHPFIANCLPLNVGGLEDLLFKNSCLQRIKRFRFSGEGLDSFSDTARVTFTEIPDQSFTFASPETVSTADTKIPAIIDTVWTGSVDSVMAAGYPPPNAANPVRVPPGKRLEISGWAIPAANSGEVFEAVYAILGTLNFKGVSTMRPDVGQYLHNPNLARCGFEISVDTSMLSKGVYPLRLVGVTRNKTYYQCPNPLYVRLE